MRRECEKEDGKWKEEEWEEKKRGEGGETKENGAI